MTDGEGAVTPHPHQSLSPHPPIRYHPRMAARNAPRVRPGTILALAPALLAAALAAAPAAADVPATPPLSPQGLAAYVRARAADGAGEGDAAVAEYRAALAAAPTSALVAIRAYREALAAGDGALARSAAAVLARAGVAPAEAALLPLADAARADDPAALERAADRLGADRFRLMVPALTVWTAAARGQPAPADPAKSDPVAQRLAAEARALRLLAEGKLGEGLTAVVTLPGQGEGSAFRLAAAELLLGANRPEEAARLVGDDPARLAAARAGAVARPGLAWAVSRLLARIAADLDDPQAAPTGIAFVRAALDADPYFARARLLLARQLALAGDTPRALAELDRVPAPFADQVAAQRIEILNRADRLAEAIRAARPLAEAKDAGPRDRARYADLLFADGRPAEALPFYERTLEEPDAKNSWAAWLRYGGALDEAGRWPQAEKALRRAVKLAPDEPSALNYLGYTLVDRREDVAEGTAMLERAHRLAPDDAAIADSLGWAYHLAGDTARALPLIEGAAAALPTDPEVGDHLGDLYWSLGRRFEARYAWAAAQVTADPRLRVRIAEKLAARFGG